MSTREAPPAPDPAARIVAVEERLTFQQRLLDELSAVLLEQGRALERQTLELASIRAVLRRLENPGNGDLRHDASPHD